MTTLTPIFTDPRHAAGFSHRGPIRELYDALLQPTVSDEARAQAISFLEEQLHDAAQMPCDLPADPQVLMQWMRDGAQRTTCAYADYLEQRRHGQPRRYFTNRAHALYFLRRVAPTKLVDGAWLYGLLPHWQELRLRPLIRTYLEELGDGVPAQNHVLLYKELLGGHGCDELVELGEEDFVQGAVQLTLGHLAEQFLPEVIGYNLGYEQLPLHLLISAYELTELGIDPYYFQLHVTIDNASTGHAHKAVQAVLENMPLVGDRETFMRRVALGYRLNEVGVGSKAVIGAFDLEEQLLGMFERKREIAAMVHSDYCRIEGRTVNQWLSEPGQIPGFLTALQTRGWIRRGQDPQHSRFWQLVHGEGAPMFGVFSAYEQQLLHDWIAGQWTDDKPATRNRKRPVPTLAHSDALDDEGRLLHAQLRALPATERPARLIQLMSPASHCTSAGLLATRLFNAYLA